MQKKNNKSRFISHQFKGIIGFEMVITIKFKYAEGIHALIVLQLYRKISYTDSTSTEWNAVMEVIAVCNGT